MLELGQRRIRSAEDIAEILNLPVLAQLDSTVTVSEQRGWKYLLTGRSRRVASVVES